MNKDSFEGKWNQLKGELKKTWGDLTDDEITKTEGDYDKTVGLIQEKYGEGKDEVRNKINDMLKNIKH